MDSLSVLSFIIGYFAFVSSASARPANTSDIVCQKLNATYDTDISLPNEVGYSNLSTENWQVYAQSTLQYHVLTRAGRPPQLKLPLASSSLTMPMIFPR